MPPRQAARLADVGDVAHRGAFARQQQDLLDARRRDDLHLACDLRLCEPSAHDVVVAVEAAVNTVIIAVIRDVKRREYVDRVAEVTPRLLLGTPRHALQKGRGGRSKERREVLDAAPLVRESTLDVGGAVSGRIVLRCRRKHLFAHIGINPLHIARIRHDVRAARWIVF